MLHRCETQTRSIKALILDAWEQDKEKLLMNLGGIDRGHRNEERIRQIEQTIESLKPAQQDDEVYIED
ncbi:MAG TPA: hypothetical protein VGL94_03910 [Ktedonobacteraceae bacterium]|jgi:hypothetical protein